MKLKVTEAERQESLAELRSMLKPGDTVHTILRHVSSSGMSRIIDMVICRDGEVKSIAWLAARVMDRSWKNDRHYGIQVGGCGMDMGFALVYNLGEYLFPDGFGLPMRLAENPNGRDGTRPKTKDEAELMASKGWKSYGHNGDASGWDKDGGYALNQRWL